MATTFVEYTGDGNATKQFTFPSYQESDVKVRVDGVLKTTSTHYNITSYTTTGGGNVVFTAGNIPSSPAKIRIYRDTNVDTAKATYTAGSSVKAGDLNNNNTQLLYRAQEEQVPNLIHSWDIADQAIETSDIKDGAVTTVKIADSNVTTAKIADSNVTTAKIADNAVTMAKLNSGALPTDITVASANIVDGTIVEADIANSAVTQNKLANNSVGTPELINGSVVTDKIAADAINGTKLADNAVDSEHYTDGSIDRVHLEADIIDSTKLADNAVNSEHYVDGSIDRVHLEADIIDSTKLADDAVGSEHIQANAVTDSEIATGTLDNRYFTETELTNGALDGRYFTETESDARYFNVSTGDTIKDGDTFPDNDTTIATTAAINDRIIDLVDDVGGFVPIANETSFPTANPDVNNGSGTLVSVKAISSTRTPSSGTVTIANGAGTGNTVTITGCGSTVLTAGFGIIVETTSTLHTYAFHRLVPKATEVTTVAGISSNITTVANNTANINAVAADASDIGIVAADGTDIGLVAGSIANVNTTAGSIANVNTTAGSITNVNNVGNNISNVNSVAGNSSNINSAVSNASNINSAVSNASNINTVAGSISNVNTTATNISSVNNVSSNISNVNNFNDRYQIAANNPTTDGGGNALAAGDLYFNTSANELKVYNGGAWQAGVTATGNFAVTTGNTFTGNNIFTAHTTHNDDVQARFGTGADLQIFHNGTNSFIQNNTNNLYLRGASAIILENTNNEDYIAAFPNGSVDLYYDNVKKIGTEADGVSLFGTNSNTYTTIGRLKATNSTVNVSYIDFRTAANSTSGDIVFYTKNSGTISEKLYISHDGIIRVPDNVKYIAGTNNDLKIFHNGSNSFFINDTGYLQVKSTNGSTYYDANNHFFRKADATENTAKFLQDGAVELYFDGSLKFATTSTGASITGRLDLSDNLDMPDNAKVIIGTGDDLQLYHNGTNSFIDSETGNLYIRGDGGQILLRPVNNEDGLILKPNGAVELYYDNAKKLETTLTGIEIYSGGQGLDEMLRLDAGGNSQGHGSKIAFARAGDVRAEIQAVKVETSHNETDIVFKTTKLGSLFEALRIVGDTGHVQIPADNKKLLLGAGQDLELYHTGTNSFIDNNTGHLYLRNKVNNQKVIVQAGIGGNAELNVNYGERAVNAIANGSTELYYDNARKFATNSVGASILSSATAELHIVGSSSGTSAGKALFKGYRNANDNGTLGELQFINQRDNDVQAKIDVVANGDTSAYIDVIASTDNNRTFRIYSGSVAFPDNNQILLGTGNDFKIYHDGTDNILQSNGLKNFIFKPKDTDVGLKIIGDGGVELYYDNSKKLETVSDGVKINNRMQFKSGTIFDNTANGNNCGISFNGDGVRPTNGAGADIDNARDLGQQSARWRNLYAVTLYGDGSNLTGIAAFPSGTKMLFAQSAAPTGWTKDTSNNNRALRVVNGSSGGNQGGSNTFTSVFNSSQSTSGGAVSNHTLSTAQIPGHNHGIQQKSIGAGCGGNHSYTGAAGTFGCSNNSTAFNTFNTGGGSSHGHGFSNPTFNLNVAYVDVIIASKD